MKEVSNGRFEMKMLAQGKYAGDVFAPADHPHMVAFRGNDGYVWMTCDPDWRADVVADKGVTDGGAE